MCMKITSRRKLGIKYAWKVLGYDRARKCWVTPIQKTKVTRNQLTARLVHTLYDDDIITSDNDIYDGAIHCFRTKRGAERNHLIKGFFGNNAERYKFRAIFQVEMIDQIAHNRTEVACRKVKFVDTINDWEI